MHTIRIGLRWRCLGLLLLALPLAAATVRIIQTNSAGDDVSIIDPVTNKVVGTIHGIEVNHGAAAAPDGSRYYISNEGQSTPRTCHREWRTHNLARGLQPPPPTLG